MKRCIMLLTAMSGMLMVPAMLCGCEREVSRTKTVDVKDDGTVKTEETTVTQNPDGSTTVTEEKTRTKP